MLRETIRFGRCELDLERSELRVAGRRVPITPTPLRVLAYLAQNRSRVVPRDELLREIWERTHVADAALHQALAHARRAVGDHGREQRIIQNVRGEGYRFVARVELAVPPPTADVFVGRKQVLRELEGHVAAALGGQGRVLLLTGAAGIGKTRTAEEVARRAQARGALVAAGAATPQAGAPSFWPWVQLFRSLGEARPVRGAFEEIENLAPGLLEPRTQRTVRPEDAPGEEALRFRAFDVAARWLWRACKLGPLCLLLDDMHDAEASALEFCEFIARQIKTYPILLLMNYRPDDALRSPDRAAVLGRVQRLPEAQSFALTGLPAPEAELLVSARVGEVLPRHVTALLADRSQGNPFYLIELARLFAAESERVDAASREAWEARIPLGVRALLAQRFASLSAPTRSMLRACAAIGFTVQRAVLSAVEPDLDVAAGLAEACNASLLTELDPAGDSYRFQHELVRQAVYDELADDPSARQALHDRIAETLESQAPTRLADVAFHLAAAVPLCSAARAVDYLARAGDRAREAVANEQAIGFYRRGLELLERWLPAEHRLRCRLLLSLGEVAIQGARADEGRGALLEAAEIARREGWPEFLCRAALAHAYRSNIMALPDEQLVPLLTTALEIVGDARNSMRARLLARLALEVRYQPDGVRRAESLIEEATALARETDEPATLARVLEDASIVRWSVSDPEGWIELNRQIVHAAGRAGDRDVLFRGVKGLATGFLEIGDRIAADREIDACAALAVESPAPYLRAVTAGLRGAQALLDADFAAGERWALEVIETGLEGATELAALQLLYQRLETAQTDGLEAIMRSHIARSPGIAGWLFALTKLLCQVGRLEDARREIDAFGDLAAIPRDRNWLPALCVLAECVFDLRDADRASTLLSLLEPHARVNAVHANGALFYGNTAHFLGLLEITTGASAAAARHLDEALAMHERMRARAWALRTRAALAALALASGRDTARRTARASAGRLREEARALGMEALVQRLDRL